MEKACRWNLGQCIRTTLSGNGGRKRHLLRVVANLDVDETSNSHVSVDQVPADVLDDNDAEDDFSPMYGVPQGTR